jgi:hypothetical protein
LYRVFYPSCLFGVWLSVYPVVKKAFSSKNGGKEALSYIALDHSINVHLDCSALLFCSLVYSA